MAVLNHSLWDISRNYNIIYFTLKKKVIQFRKIPQFRRIEGFRISFEKKN